MDAELEKEIAEMRDEYWIVKKLGKLLIDAHYAYHTFQESEDMWKLWNI